MANADEILAFWLDQVGPKGWYTGGPELDQEIRDRFESVYNRVREGSLSLWLTYPTGTLAYIILTDQFSRNMFRDTGQAFATDKIARAAAAILGRGSLDSPPQNRHNAALPFPGSSAG